MEATDAAAGEPGASGRRGRADSDDADEPLSARLQTTPGWCARDVEQELPGLRLLTLEITVGRQGSLTGDSPADLKERLRELSNRFRGATAVAVRREPVPSAYRVFFRHIGLDPEVQRTPIEAAVLERMTKGGFLSGGLLEDALLIALIDTRVPVAALDAEHVADASSPLAVLFGEAAAGHQPTARTRRLSLFAVQVAGVPELYAEEALWVCGSSLQAS
jgi:hypothetical protein